MNKLEKSVYWVLAVITKTFLGVGIYFISDLNQGLENINTSLNNLTEKTAVQNEALKNMIQRVEKNEGEIRELQKTKKDK